MSVSCRISSRPSSCHRPATVRPPSAKACPGQHRTRLRADDLGRDDRPGRAESFEAELDALLELVAAELNLRRLTARVMRTARQGNALERVVIPRLVAEQRHIAATLEQRALEDRARVWHRAGRHPRPQWFPRCAGPAG